MHSLLIRIRLLLTIGIIAFPLWYFLKELLTHMRRAGDTLQTRISQAKQHIEEEESVEDDITLLTDEIIPQEMIVELQIQEEVIVSVSEEPAEITQDTMTEDDERDEQAFDQLSPEKLTQQIDDIKYAALTYKERGKLDDYEKKLIEGIALAGDHEEFLSMLTDHYFDAGHYVKASTLLKRLIQIRPDHHKALRQLGQIYLRDKDQDTARLLLEKARELKDDHPKYLISLVELYYEMGELREAITIVERLSKLRPTNTDYLLTLAKLHEEINQPTKAHTYYMKVLELNPLNDEAKKAIKRLL